MGILTASQAEILGKIERNAAIKLRSLSSAVVALATGGAAYWFSLSSADQAAKLAEHPVLVPYAPYIIGLGWLVAALYPQWIRLNASKAEQFAAMRAELERLKAAVLAGERGPPAGAAPAPAPAPAVTVAPPPAPIAPAPRGASADGAGLRGDRNWRSRRPGHRCRADDLGAAGGRHPARAERRLRDTGGRAASVRPRTAACHVPR